MTTDQQLTTVFRNLGETSGRANLCLFPHLSKYCHLKIFPGWNLGKIEVEIKKK